MKFAAIDIGSNAVRLLLSRVEKDSKYPAFEKVSLIRIPIRLGDDAFIHKKISQEKVSALVDTMMGFKYLIKAYGPIEYMACATSAMREAKNGEDIAATIRDKCGIDLEIISGKKEARFVSSNHKFDMLSDRIPYLYIDVGGGSTEITLFDNKNIVESRSFDIGTIRIREGLVAKKDWKVMEKWVKKITSDYGYIAGVGSGGNINKIYSLSKKKSNSPMDYKEVKKIANYLKDFTLEERITQLKLKPDRADVIVPASKIYLSVMKWAGIKDIYVPQVGLSDGMIYVMYKEHKKKYV